MLKSLWACFRAIWRFRDYKPKPVTVRTLRTWLYQFSKEDRKAILSLLNEIIYLNEKQIRDLLVRRNALLVNKLSRQGIPPQKTIYVQIDEAGSSSAVMLNMLRDAALLERSGCSFLDSKDIMGLYKLTNKVEDGAIIYVDDFIGTGNQFCKSRDFAVQHIVGTFAEFLLAPCICEEAFYELGKRGIEACAGHIHSKAERPLHEYSTSFDPRIKDRLIEISRLINKKGGLGYKELATMIVLYRNSPNTLPLILRGSIHQSPYVGLLPRTTDLPPLAYDPIAPKR